MKKIKYFVLIFIIVILLCLMLFLVKKSKKENCIDKIDLNEIYSSVMDLTNTPFKLVDNYNDEHYLSVYIPENIDLEKDALIAVQDDDETEYFMVVRNLNDEQIKKIKTVIEYGKQDITIQQYESILYVISSSKNSSTIEGVIRSYIYCERR